MIENDASKSLALYHKNNNPENEITFPERTNSYGMTAFLMRSLEKIKRNTRSEVLKKLIDTYIGEYLFHIKDFHHGNIIHETIEVSVKDPSFTFYAKTAYNKVVKEEECLKRLLDILERNNFEKM
jgi:hypothetical protein